MAGDVWYGMEEEELQEFGESPLISISRGELRELALKAGSLLAFGVLAGGLFFFWDTRHPISWSGSKTRRSWWALATGHAATETALSDGGATSGPQGARTAGRDGDSGAACGADAANGHSSSTQRADDAFRASAIAGSASVSLIPAVAPPPPRVLAAAAFDESSGTFFVHGGVSGADAAAGSSRDAGMGMSIRGDLHAYDGARFAWRELKVVDDKN